ncbi:MAG: rhodanese-like domain-containing protein [Chloroflexota bacterium]
MDLLSRLFGPPVPSVNVHKLNEKLKSGKRPVVIDVREPQEYQAGHIAGAKLIPLGSIKQHLNELPKDKEIVCVCASGSRSSSAARQLIKAGYTVLDMSGGMMNWQRAGFPVKKGSAA